MAALRLTACFPGAAGRPPRPAAFPGPTARVPAEPPRAAARRLGALTGGGARGGTAGPRRLPWRPAFDAGTGRGVRVVLIDTGLDPHLPLLRHAALRALDFTGLGGGDPAGHGTRGAALLLCPDPDGTPALAGAIELTVCRAVGAGMGPVARALAWATRHRAQVVALPFGRLAGDAAVAEALAALAAAGALIVAAAGNRGPEALLYPARAPRVSAVTGAWPDGSILEECCAGPGVDLLAPGAVRCALGGGTLRGSSAATVVAAGVLALGLEAG